MDREEMLKKREADRLLLLLADRWGGAAQGASSKVGATEPLPQQPGDAFAKPPTEAGRMNVEAPSYADMVEKVYGVRCSAREKQQEVLDAVAQGRDVFALLPTGGGKSDTVKFPGEDAFVLREGR